MPLPACSTRIRMTRRGLLLGGFGSARVCLGAEALRPRLNGDRLVVAAPQLRFLAGRPLERLHNGASVWFDLQLSAWAERPGAAGASPRLLERAIERFAVSYDLWEEKYSVSRLGRPARAVSHLTSGAAEAWCLEQLPLATASLASDHPFWLSRSS